jgi:hypothetical protein
VCDDESSFEELDETPRSSLKITPLSDVQNATDVTFGSMPVPSRVEVSAEPKMVLSTACSALLAPEYSGGCQHSKATSGADSSRSFNKGEEKQTPPNEALLARQETDQTMSVKQMAGQGREVSEEKLRPKVADLEVLPLSDEVIYSGPLSPVDSEATTIVNDVPVYDVSDEERVSVL